MTSKSQAKRDRADELAEEITGLRGMVMGNDPRRDIAAALRHYGAEVRKADSEACNHILRKFAAAYDITPEPPYIDTIERMPLP